MTAEAPGGGFLLGPAPPAEPAASPLGQASRDFVRRRVLAQNGALERGDPARLRALLGEAGAAGLLGVEIPEAYGGLGADPHTACAVLSGLGLQASFAVTCAAHLTIGAVPLLRHGGEALCREHLPAIASGRAVGAYALTEPAGGSDALNLATRAVPAPGGFRLSGEKHFISNAAIADHLVVIALVEGHGPTAFFVDARAAGLELGPEERKLGLRGSSTRVVRLDGVFVPEARTIGGVGQGHRVALDALTVGRHHLGVLAAGHLELILEVSAAYAAERRQFGRPIGERALVAEMLAEGVAQAFALEAAVERAAPLCAPDVPDLGPAGVEAAICKVLGAETAGRVVDMGLQIFAGIGYLQGSWVEQSYRDARVNRIYEGTDEINRRAIAQGLLRAARRGRLALSTGAVSGAGAERLRRMAHVAVTHAVAHAGDVEPLEGPLADLAIAAYAATSAVARADSEDARAAAELTVDRWTFRALEAWSLLGEALPLPDAPPPGRTRRAELRAHLARRALEAGRSPLARYAPIKPPTTTEGA